MIEGGGRRRKATESDLQSVGGGGGRREGPECRVDHVAMAWDGCCQTLQRLLAAERGAGIGARDSMLEACRDAYDHSYSLARFASEGLPHRLAHFDAVPRVPQPAE